MMIPVLIAMLIMPAAVLAGDPGGRGTSVKPKPKPVRAALEGCYAKMVRAYHEEHPEWILALRAPDFHAILPNGEVWNAARGADYIRAAFVQVETTLVVTFEIGVIQGHGDTAAAEIDQHWVRRQQKGGALRLVDTRAHQRETWIQQDGDWLLWRVDRVAPGAWIVDGKRIDPSRPYDPDAPPYDPPDRR